MRIQQVVPHVDPRVGGPAYSVVALTTAIARRGETVGLHFLSSSSQLQGREFESRSYRASAVLPPLGISRAMKQSLRAVAQCSDVIHSHCLWMMPGLYAASAIRDTGCRLVISPRGTLEAAALRRSRFRKQLMWWMLQRSSLRSADCLHATGRGEYEAIRRCGLRAPVAVIPIGVDLPRTMAPNRRSPERCLLSLSRLHPHKGLDMLLRAWRRVQDRYPDWMLRIVGPDNDGYASKLTSLGAQLEVRRVSFDGPKFEEEKDKCFSEADVFVLPSRSESFGVAVAEALAHGVPAIVTKGAPWEGLQTHDCGWWIDGTADALADTLGTVLALPPEALRARGERGRRWVSTELSWHEIGRKTVAVYRWLLDGGQPPAWVLLD